MLFRSEKAQTAARALFCGQGDLDNMPCFCLCETDFADGRIDILSVVHKCGLASSRSEARRNVEQGGVCINGTQEKNIKTCFEKEAFAGDGMVVRRGKKNFMKIVMGQ